MNWKLITLALAILLILSLTACNSDTVPATEPTDATEVILVPGVVEMEIPATNPFETEGTEGTDPTAKPENPTEATNPKTEDPKDVTTPSEEATEPTEETLPSEEVTEPTEETTPSEETVPPTEGGNQGSAGKTAYEDYINMTGEQQLAFMQSFDSMEAFFAWLNAAKAEYEAQNPGTDVGDGNIDLGGGN